VSHDIRELTKAYVAAFDNGDIDGVAALMDDNFVLTDPENAALGPREKVLEFISGLFRHAGDRLSFRARTVLVDGDYSVVEFDLEVGDDRFEGIDLIEWRDGLMVSMRAHLTSRPPQDASN
jgi:ketosteroid isomerase-like protein